MSSNGRQSSPAVSVRSLGKCYHIYDTPQDRLKQSFWRGRKKFYREFWALRGVSFDVNKGESIGLIGRNGSGKSTLLQIVAGTLTPAEGEVHVRGRVAALLELGSGFNPEFTGRENIFMNGAILGIPRNEMKKRFSAIAAFADIGEFIDQPVKTYSSGMYVRLAFSVAINVDPEILLIDEALAVGDIFFQQKCMQHMKENLAGVTKLLVTHDMHAVTTLADRVLVFEDGELALEAPPLEAIEYYIKSAHNDMFSPPPSEADGQRQEKLPDLDENLPWIDVDEQGRGGAGEVRIERVAVTGTDNQGIPTVHVDDTVVVRMIVQVSVPKRNLIFGYFINDRLGNGIFGENTCSLPDSRIQLDCPGHYLVKLEFNWPEIRPAEYTITLGIGEGTDPLHHIIQCWAHNVAAFSAISPSKAVHFLFNNPIRHFEMSAVTESYVGDTRS